MRLEHTKQARVAVASLMHESNSFNPEKTVWADFQLREGGAREATLRCWSADFSEVAGFLEAGSHAGFELLPILHAAATPKGPVDLAAFERLAQRLLFGLTAALPLDGILLALHGAMYVEEYPHADEELIRRVRSVLGNAIPLVVTHDFHANIPPSLAELRADCGSRKSRCDSV